jgi:hypothetical protein
MASGEDPCPPHPVLSTQGKQYCFSQKHHGRGASGDARWIEDLDQEEEFSIFDFADRHDLLDAKGNLYGLRRSPEGRILDLGTRGEQVAKFWWAPEDQPWHGFPLWPLAVGGVENRRKQPAPREALHKMEEAGVLATTQRKRLQKGDRIR